MRNHYLAGIVDSGALLAVAACTSADDTAGSGAGATTGVSGSGGMGSSSTTTSGAGGGATSSPSDLPVPPGPADLPKPSGAAGNLKVLPWGGFTSAVTYTLDDAQTSHTEHWPELKATGAPMTFYLNSFLKASQPGFEAT